MAPLRRWQGIRPATFERYAGGGSAVRISRLLDLVPAGARILDIGIGRGYITGVLLRDLRPAHYCGVDLRETFVDSTREMLAANDLGDRPVELVLSDIFDLDAEFWARHDPDVVLLLEMLEHVEDPGAALRAIAAGARPGATVIFTVPLPGHLDGVWGHRSVFDSRRLVRLCRQAGLRLERAEPLQSTWALVAATVTGEPPAEPPAGPEPAYTFTRVAERQEEPDGAVRLPMPSPRVVRLELGVEPPGAAGLLRVRGVDREGETRLEWTGEVTGAGSGERTTYVLKPGRPAHELRPGRARKPEGVEWLHVSVEAKGGTELTLAVNRAAYLGSGAATTDDRSA